jgi:hypothetical protein
MNSRQEYDLMDACRILFPSSRISRDFLHCIKSDGLKSAYRNRVWECHPDACSEDRDQTRRTELFRRSVEAYNLLTDFLKSRKSVVPLVLTQPQNRPTAKPVKPNVMPKIEVFERNESEQYYDGPMPAMELKIGLYLYYRGIISYQTLVHAIMWQRDQRPPLGDFARQWGWLSEEDVAKILRATHFVGSFGERAVALELLTQSQLNIILLHQRSMQKHIGRYFVAQSILSEMMLKQHLRELVQHNRQVREFRD